MKLREYNYKKDERVQKLQSQIREKLEEKTKIEEELKLLRQELKNVRSEHKLPGIYTPGKYGTQDSAYKRWKGICNRCYNPLFHRDYPRYKGCSVCDEWLDFQTFAEWYYATCPGEPQYYDIDKDLINPNNKIYSPENCEWLPRELNILIKNDGENNKTGYVGVAWDKDKNKYRVRFEFMREKISGGYFKDPEEAHQTYLKLKKECIIKGANMFKDKISERAYNALINYEIKTEK